MIITFHLGWMLLPWYIHVSLSLFFSRFSRGRYLLPRLLPLYVPSLQRPVLVGLSPLDQSTYLNWTVVRRGGDGSPPDLLFFSIPCTTDVLLHHLGKLPMVMEQTWRVNRQCYAEHCQCFCQEDSTQSKPLYFSLVPCITLFA